MTSASRITSTYLRIPSELCVKPEDRGATLWILYRSSGRAQNRGEITPGTDRLLVRHKLGDGGAILEQHGPWFHMVPGDMVPGQTK
jgi:hypothetical protein